jgi:hypothetical protein
LGWGLLLFLPVSQPKSFERVLSCFLGAELDVPLLWSRFS